MKHGPSRVATTRLLSLPGSFKPHLRGRAQRRLAFLPVLASWFRAGPPMLNSTQPTTGRKRVAMIPTRLSPAIPKSKGSASDREASHVSLLMRDAAEVHSVVDAQRQSNATSSNTNLSCTAPPDAAMGCNITSNSIGSLTCSKLHNLLGSICLGSGQERRSRQTGDGADNCALLPERL